MPVRVVPLAPPEMDLEEIRVSKPVRGSGQWQDMARNAIYLKGKGGQLSAMNPTRSLAVAGSVTYESFVWPRGTGIDRLWIVTLSGLPTGTGSDPLFVTTNAFGTITDSQTGDFIDWTLGGGNPQTFFLVAAVASSTTAAQANLTITNNTNSETAVTVQSVSCVELPRVTLNADDAPNGSTCKKPKPIYDANDKSVTGVAEHQKDAFDTARRNFHFGWSEDTTGVAITTTAFVGDSNILVDDPPVLGRKLRNADTTTAIAWNVYAKVSSGTGEVRVTAVSGDTDTITITSTSKAWQTAGAIQIDAEQMSALLTDGGKRDGDRDTLQFEGRVTTAGPTLTVYAISAGEELPAAAPLTPGDIFSGVYDWWRYDLGVTLNGSDVSSWAGQNGQGNDLIQNSAAKQPLFSSGTGPNGVDEIQFTAANSDHLLDSSLAAGIGSGDRMYIFVVGQYRSGTTGTGFEVGTPSGFTNRFQHLLVSSGSQWRFYAAGLSDGAQSVNVSGGADATDHFWEVSNASTNIEHVVDGTATTGTINGTMTWTAGKAAIGSRVSASAFADFNCSEFVIVGPTAPSAGEISDWESYVNDTYGL